MVGARDLGAIEFLRAALPAGALDALGILTWLGGVAFVVGLLTAVYWFGARDRGAFGLGVALGALSLTIASKAFFALPRPPASGRLIGAMGYGFPSGHAIAATVTWGYLAFALDWGTRRRRYAVAALVAGVVALSRVALGVHYAADVVAGVSVGAAYLALLTRLDGPERAFGVAVVVSLAAVAVTGGGGDALLLLGGAAAGAVLWSRLSVPPVPWQRAEVVPAVGGGGAIAGLVFVGYRGDFAPPVEFAVGAVAVAAILGLPVLVERLRAKN